MIHKVLEQLARRIRAVQDHRIHIYVVINMICDRVS